MLEKIVITDKERIDWILEVLRYDGTDTFAALIVPELKANRNGRAAIDEARDKYCDN